MEDLQKQCVRLVQSVERSRRELYQSYACDAKREYPSRAICDELVKLYLSSFEQVLRVLHIPTFWDQYRQYWQSSSRNSDFHYTLSMVMAIGICIHATSGGLKCPLRSYALKSILDAQKRVTSTCEGTNVTVATIQTYCLVLIAQQTTGFGPNTMSVTIDGLVRAAMRLDLHRPHRPNSSSTLSAAEIQLRKKLWCTVVELSIQSSLDTGLPPSLLPADLVLELPVNMNDADIGQDLPTTPDLSSKTDTTIQILLAQTTTTRLKILHHLYGFTSVDSYSTTLKLGSELANRYRTNAKILEGLLPHARHGGSGASTGFQIMILNSLTLGPLMVLHSPYAHLARDSPEFYYSRKVCFEAAWTLTSQSLPQSAQLDGASAHDLHDRLLLHATGIFERVQSQASALICMEMLNSFKEESFLSNALFDSASVFGAMQQSVDSYARRLENGSNDVAIHVILSCALAHIRALHNKLDSHVSVAEMAVQSLRECSQKLQSAAGTSTPQSSMSDSDGVPQDVDVFDDNWWAGIDPLDLTATSSPWWAGDETV